MTETTAGAERALRSGIVGNLTRDPELRYSANGTAWAGCGLAVNPRVRRGDGSFEELPAEFFELVCFADTAEHLTASASKGTRVIAVGRVETETWTGRDGTERTTRKLIADEIGVPLRFANLTVQRASRSNLHPRNEFEEPF
jgi:single-strand DNA-binding protein